MNDFDSNFNPINSLLCAMPPIPSQLHAIETPQKRPKSSPWKLLGVCHNCHYASVWRLLTHWLTWFNGVIQHMSPHACMQVHPVRLKIPPPVYKQKDLCTTCCHAFLDCLCVFKGPWSLYVYISRDSAADHAMKCFAKFMLKQPKLGFCEEGVKNNFFFVLFFGIFTSPGS